MIGALLGLGTQMYSNALRKLPYMRRKSLHSSSFSFPIHQKKKKKKTHTNPQKPILMEMVFTCRSMGARGWHGSRSCVRESAREMGRSARRRPR